MPGSRSSPSSITSELITGHFHETSGYGIVRERGTADWLLIYTVAGRGRFGFKRGELIAEPGDVVVHRPGAFHDYGVEPTLERWELLWTHFLPRADWIELLDWPEEAPGLMRIHLGEPAARARTTEQLSEIHAFVQGGGRQRERYAMNALERLLLDLDGHNPASAQARLDPRVRTAMDFLARNLHGRLTLADVARAAGLSVSRLAHLFKSETGTTPQQFLEHRRMRRAQDMLALTGQPIRAIAAEFGFDNAFYFSSRFRKHTGHSPRQYRQRHVGGTRT